jgi:hypothetical protein
MGLMIRQFMFTIWGIVALWLIVAFVAEIF